MEHESKSDYKKHMLLRYREKYGASMINLSTDSYIDSRRMQFHYLL